MVTTRWSISARQRVLDPVADRVRFGDRHAARHDQVELQEGQPAGVAGAQVMRLQSRRRRFRPPTRGCGCTTAGSGAASISPPTELEIIRMPDQST